MFHQILAITGYWFIAGAITNTICYKRFSEVLFEAMANHGIHSAWGGVILATLFWPVCLYSAIRDTIHMMLNAPCDDDEL